MQPKATTLASIKPNQQVVTFFLQILARENAESSKNSNFQSNTQQYVVTEQALMHYTGAGTKTQKTKTLKTNCKVLLDHGHYT